MGQPTKIRFVHHLPGPDPSVNFECGHMTIWAEFKVSNEILPTPPTKTEALRRTKTDQNLTAANAA